VSAAAEGVAVGGDKSALDELLAELEDVRSLLAEATPPPLTARSAALDRLCSLFRLSEFERSVVLLCAGVELDPEIARLSTCRGGPSFGLALEALPGAHWSALTPAAPLRRWRLVRIVPDSGPLTAMPIRIEERILHALAGVDAPEADLDGVVSEPAPPGELVAAHERLAERLAELLASEREAGRWPTVQLSGEEAAVRRDVAVLAAARSGLRLLAVDAGTVPGAQREAAALARLCAREAAISGAALLLDTGDLDLDPERRAAAVRFALRLEAALVVGARERLAGLERGFVIDLPSAPVADRRALWRSALGERTTAASLNGALDAVVGQFDLEPKSVRAAAREALAGTEPGLADRLWAACRTRVRQPLDDLAQRIDSSAGWDDLVLPRGQLATLREIAAQVRWRVRVYDDWGFAARTSRGLGISVLFAGPSGTGKTMAAEVLANELRLDLFRIDLSSVVSKYIGETEKNLRRVFSAAERGGAVLLFDEADALFGKRTEVRDSHDRFANIEVSYLLQRMEAYRGLAILTTNQRRALDAAFLRRLRFIVEFPFPEAPERAAIWDRVLPATAPTEGLDLERLSRLAIAGGNIRNVALGAAFLAAEEGASLRMGHVLRAARTEYAKLERPLTEPELAGWAGAEELR
jgi:hypothetical protein